MASADLFGSPFDRREEEEGDEDSGLHPADENICRVCRSNASPGRPLFHPCLCTGSIKYIHQDCLVQWLRHSGKEYCELCKHQFEFAPIYRPDMPHRLPLSDVVGGMMQSTLSNIRHWIHLGFVALMWLIVVPICIYRIYRFLLYGSLFAIASFPLQLLSLESLVADCIYGLVIVFLSLLGFIALIWLKDQVSNGRGPGWLENNREEVNRQRDRAVQERAAHLRRYLEQEGERAREREQAPERVTIARELQELHSELDDCTTSLQRLQEEAFGREMVALRVREMRLMYDLGTPLLKHRLLLKSARAKRWEGLEVWKRAALNEMSQGFPITSNDQGATPSDTRVLDGLSPPSDEELGLDAEEREVLALFDREPMSLGQTEREEAMGELERVKEERDEVNTDHQRHQQLIVRLMAHKDSDGECREMHRVTASEETLVLEARHLRTRIKEARRREQGVVEHQAGEARRERQEVEERMNRWYNRLLRRHQDDPLVLARRNGQQDHQLQRQRPNIGHALAGLARDPPVDQPNQNGENVEELTWARLLGLDGSFRFLEHVLWLIFLNSILIIGFVYLPYKCGSLVAQVLSLWDWIGIVTWRGVISIIIGYVLAVVMLVVFYYSTGLLRTPRLKTYLGVMYVALKVGMILAIEAGIFPLICGWWIDICALSLFGSTLQSRSVSMQNAPGTVTFLHWLAGMIFVFYLAAFVVLLREVLRPGVLWFLRNLNDQNFHPIQEMINLPFPRHLRRFTMSCVMFGSCVMVILLLPSRAINYIFHGFLPYNLSLTSSVSPIREVQLELILLQFVIPTLLEHGNCRTGLKVVIRAWAHASAYLFGLGSYLLDKPQSGGVVVNLHEQEVKRIPADAPLDNPVYDGPLEVLGPGFAPFKPYLRPSYFYLRVVGFLAFTALVATVFSMLLLTLPVFLGRIVMQLVGISKAPEIYTVAIGLYLLWLLIRSSSTMLHYIAQGLRSLTEQFRIWSVQGGKCLIAGVLLFIVIPLLLGHLVDLLIVIPLRVPADRTPVFYPSTEWALGLLHTKCMCGAIWLTNIRFKRNLDRLYQDGIRNLSLEFVIREVAWPVILGLSLCISVPYVFFMGVLPTLGVVSYSNSLLVYRYIFPSVLAFIIISTLGTFFVSQTKRLYGHIRNEKYLIGRQLVNYSTAPAYDEQQDNLLEAVQETGERGL